MISGVGVRFVFFFCTSNKKLVDFFLPRIKGTLPNKKILEYHGKCKGDLSNVNDDWKDADIICCTASITVGCNFDLENVFWKLWSYIPVNKRSYKST